MMHRAPRRVRMYEGRAPTPLTPHERAILQAIVDGGQRQHMAKRFGLTDSSLKTALWRIRVKLEAGNLAHAVGLAARRGDIALHGGWTIEQQQQQQVVTQ